jgi:hypothetical protein
MRFFYKRNCDKQYEIWLGYDGDEYRMCCRPKYDDEKLMLDRCIEFGAEVERETRSAGPEDYDICFLFCNSAEMAQKLIDEIIEPQVLMESLVGG